jgi:Flp pilus assembly protein TadB
MEFNTSLQVILLATLTGIGIFLAVAAFALHMSSVTTRILEDETGPRIKGIAEGNIIRAMSIDLSKKLKPETGNLEERLRKSGWIYKDIAEYHVRRILHALIYFFFGVAIPILFGLAFEISVGILTISIVGTLMAILGFNMVDRGLNNAINKRRERLKREMGFGLERISLLLQSGAPLMEALAHTANMGLFGKACARISSRASTGAPISEITLSVREDLPDTPEFDEFMEMMRMGIQKGQEMVDPFRERAEIMRERLQLDIIEAGNKAKISVTLLTSAFILLASMIVTIGPVLVILTQEGLF